MRPPSTTPPTPPTAPPRRARASASSRWTGALFAIGSTCFALGSLPLYFDHIDAEVVAGTFFVGSIFFTSAAALQFVGASHTPRSVDWWAAAVQLVGTVCFNISTFAATRTSLDPDQQRRLIWAPDVWGSICFLIASALACAAVAAARRPSSVPNTASRNAGGRSAGWWIAALNMTGSVAFGLSAIGARYLPTTGVTANITLVNTGTFVGAVCFFAGAVLLPVDDARTRASAVTVAEGGPG